MKKNDVSPCATCSRVKDPGNCENKCCGVWRNWFMRRWKLIHGFYLANKEEKV